MSAERTKVLWISAAVAAFALVIALAGVFLFAPTRSGAEAPASVGNMAAPKARDPQDYLQAPLPTPSIEAPPKDEGDVIVIYGDKPSDLSPLPPTEGSTPASNATPGASAAAAEPVRRVESPTPAPTVKPTAAPIKPAAAAPKKTTPSMPATASSPKPHYWVQTGSFTRRDLAEGQKKDLADKGIAAILMVKDIDGKSWYRVRIGPYTSKKEAEGWLGKLKSMTGYEQSTIWQ